MQPTKLLHKLFKNNRGPIHRTRLKAVFECVEALVNNKRLTLTLLGRHIKNGAKIRSNIRKADRLLGNKHLQSESIDFYRLMNIYVINKGSRPWLHVDWSCLSTENSLYVLRASLSMKGRALVVYEEVHPKKHENNHGVHVAFLEKLKTVLPDKTHPIIIADAGFRCLWFKAISQMGWDYVGRLRNKNAVKIGENEWTFSKKLYSKATRTPRHLGSGLLTRSNRLATQFIIFKGKSKKRHATKHQGSGKSKQYSQANKEPWMLVTSLKTSRQLAKKVVKLYRERMQIEENFRDTKNKRYGFGLNESGTKSVERMKVLLLIGAIAHYLCWLAGLISIQRKKAADYQAHSAKFTSALSVVYLGCEVLRKKIKVTWDDIWASIEHLISLSNSSYAGDLE